MACLKSIPESELNCPLALTNSVNPIFAGYVLQRFLSGKKKFQNFSSSGSLISRVGDARILEILVPKLPNLGHLAPLESYSMFYVASERSQR